MLRKVKFCPLYDTIYAQKKRGTFDYSRSEVFGVTQTDK